MARNSASVVTQPQRGGYALNHYIRVCREEVPVRCRIVGKISTLGPESCTSKENNFVRAHHSPLREMRSMLPGRNDCTLANIMHSRLGWRGNPRRYRRSCELKWRAGNTGTNNDKLARLSSFYIKEDALSPTERIPIIDKPN